MFAHARRFSLCLFAVAAVLTNAERALAQTNITWGNSGNDWTVPSNWVGGVVPLAADSGFFVPNNLGPTQNPFIPGSTTQQLQNMLIANGPLFTNYVISGGSSSGLNLSANGVGGTLTIRGVGQTIFDGPVVSGNGSPQLAITNLGSSTELVFRGASTLNSSVGQMNFRGGQFTLDNSGTNVLNRLSMGTSIVSMDTGHFYYISNAAGGTSTINTNTSGLTIGSGDNTVTIDNGAVSSQAILAFGGLNRANAGAVLNINVAGGGTLGGSGTTDPQFRINGVTNANWVVGGLPTTASTGSGTAAGHVFVNGTDFAAILSLSSGVASLGAVNATAVNSTTISTATGNVNFTPNAGGTTTLTASPNVASLKISVPSGETTLDLNGRSITTNGVLLPGFENYTITDSSGTPGIFMAGTATKVIYVTNRETTLFLGARMGGGSGPVVKSGDGYLALTGTANLFAFGANQNINLNAGTLRATISGATPNLGSTNNSLRFRGGILEIANGSNGSGASADFVRGLGTGSGTTSFGGSGGFSAFGSNASVNIGGAASPTSLQWGATNFVGDGYSLVFGSTQSNALLRFLNPLQLDNGTTYQAREIRVIAGAGGDGTVMAGGITGASNADLIKSGFGTLVLPTGATHSYQGTTFIPEGTLQVDGTITSGSKPVIVGIQGKGSQGTLAGTGTVNRDVYVQPTGTLSPGTATPVRNPGVLTVNGGISMFGPGATMDFQIQSGTTPGNGPGFHSQLIVTGTKTIDLGNASLNLDFNNATYTPTLADRIVLIDYSSGPATLTGTFSGLPDGALTVSDVLGSGLNYYIFYGTLSGYANRVVLAPVPEPLHILLVGAAGAAGYRWIRRRKAIKA